MAEPHPDYWKLKAIALETQVVRAQAQTAVDTAVMKQAKAFADAGLRPEINYQFVDADESIVPVP